jgi:hypothetical protein
MSSERRKKGPKYHIWDKKKEEYIFNRVYDLRHKDGDGNRIMPLGMRNALRESGMTDQQFAQEYKGVVIVDDDKLKNYTRKQAPLVDKPKKGTRKVRFDTKVDIINEEPKEKEKEKGKRRAKGKPFHIWDASKEQYRMLRVYELRNKDENGNRLMPIGMRNLLTTEDFNKNYLEKSDGKLIVVDENKQPIPETIADKLLSFHPLVIDEQPTMKIYVRKSKTNADPNPPASKIDANVVDANVVDANVVDVNVVDAVADIDTDEQLPTEPDNKESDVKDSEDAKDEETYIDDPNYDFLYPELNDPNFNIKIAKRKEFNDTKYDGTIHDIKKQADILCKSDFELMPHQLFVKNFLSLHTPYNSLLLYHGLGTGKTCSAIGIAEEMRRYTKQVGLKKTILIIASPNVQDNFRVQLFDERKLKNVNGVWNLQSCVGASLLKEINPTAMTNITREKISSQIRSIISSSYEFMGYTAFANYISDAIEVKGVGYSPQEVNKIRLQKIKNTFNNRLIIIDEVHNIRITKENKKRKSAELLMNIAKHTDNMRLVLMSATPMYNSYEEIIWLTNLMNINDKRGTISLSDIFTKKGEFKSDEAKTLLRRKLTGYVSYIRGENPYTFPYRIYPEKDSGFAYPTKQFNGKTITPDEALKHVPVFLNGIGEHQAKCYNVIIEGMRKKNLSVFDDMDSFGYTMLQVPLEALNIAYPTEDMSDESLMIGKDGLSNIMKFKEVHSDNKPQRYNFDYKTNKYGRIFSESELHKYSAKMAKICEMVKQAKGIVLIYSQYIDGGAVPMALALEEMGFSRYGYESYTKSLFASPPVPPLGMDPDTKLLSNTTTTNPAKYVMITGDKTFSPNNDEDIKYLNSKDNLNGEKVKVVIISRAAGEGIDFKRIRQVHILEPWYNMNRIEQIIGRAVRNMSHCDLPFEERNVEIFLHATSLPEESADLYVYRLAEQKSFEIGKITRILKEVAVDCILNIAQTNFTVEKLLSMAENKEIKITLSSGKAIQYTVGDRPFTDTCDYMDNCSFTCSPSPTTAITKKDIQLDTYNDEFISVNNQLIIQRIRDLFSDMPKGRHFFTRDELINSINIVKQYPTEQIYSALTNLIENTNEHITDRYGRQGNLVNNGDYYMFQPVEISDKSASVYERSIPVDVKHDRVHIKLPAKADAHIAPTVDFDALMTKFNENFSLATTGKGGKTWYGILRKISKHIETQHKITDASIKKHSVHHIFDETNLNTKLTMLNTIYNGAWKPSNEFETLVKDYFDGRIITATTGEIGIILCKDNTETYKVYSQMAESGELKWGIAEHVTSERIIRSADFKRKYALNKATLNDTIGFVSWWEGHEEYVFKVRDLKDSGSKVGRRADQYEIKDIIIYINQVLGENTYNIKNTIELMGEGKNKLVVLIEILLREFNDIKTEKTWYLNNEQFTINKISNFTKN